jgi:predicted Fe-Mo cluster-binding NifX family protein
VKVRMAIASQGRSGLDDVISQVFGRSPTFTIIDIGDGKVKRTKVENNPSANASHGAGPLTCMRLSRLGVNVVVGASFGPTVSAILKEAEIEAVTADAGTRIESFIQQFLKTRSGPRLQSPRGT